MGEVRVDRGSDAICTNRAIHLRYLTEEGRDMPEVERYLATDDVTLRFLPDQISAWNLRDTPQARAVSRAGAARPLQ